MAVRCEECDSEGVSVAVRCVENGCNVRVCEVLSHTLYVHAYIIIQLTKLLLNNHAHSSYYCMRNTIM